ncbi:MAG TPA: M28 family peptidase [Pseudomonadota bacterium]|nr:M28 family peptidase [Rhodanobacteraceae bacterium]MBP9155272.1 M28 family peptidase [Xanthomonadales bacterium]HQW81117.1 M28 family peptidase [Pseudomonadota bacterium]
MLSALTLGLQMGLTTAMPMPASVIALGTQPQFEVDAYTRQIEDRGGWWLELDDRLLVVAPATALPELVAGEQVLDELGWIRPDELALQARGCAIHPSAPLPAIARAGRYALVRTPATLLPYQLPEISEWRPVVPNRSIAQDWRARGRIDLAKRTVNPAVQQRVDTVDRDRWFGVLEDLAIYDRSSRHLDIVNARDWLLGQFARLGLQTSIHAFPMSGTVAVPQENVIGTLVGTTLPDEWIIVGAHYDSIQINAPEEATAAPGAEDNASGCAAVVEMAEVFTRFPPQRTMIFTCFSGEEQGLIGSTHWVEQALFPAGDLPKIKLALIMDMIGYSSDGQYDVLLETSNMLSSVFQPFQNAVADYASELVPHTSTYPFGSDHMPFIDRSVPSLLVIEYDYDDYPGYHKTTDVPGAIAHVLDMGGGVLKMNAAVLTEAAGYNDNSVFRDDFE